MKQNIILFLVTLGISTGVCLFFFRACDQSKGQQRVENIRLKLESDLNHLLKTRQTADIATVMQANPVHEHTQVEKQLKDDSKMDELDLGAYLQQLLISETVQHLQINAVSFDAQGTIQKMVVTPQP
jgi:hypothetical protein